jgi:SAM-dependent methyltransferase|tara:strand:- start:508 stop:1713 length:1206 start_codon:yes stop_codon:yes gene_type:complete
MSDYKVLDECLCCSDSTYLNLLLDLNEQPLANSYHDNSSEMDRYPLGVNLCENCYHIQLTHSVNPNLLFKDYLYVSGTTETLRHNMKWFADYVVEQTPFHRTVLDIACNDGTQLDYFKEKGFETYGIDPAENLYELSSKNHNITCDYFENGWWGGKEFDVITAQNVFAHINNPLEFLNHCERLMHDDSILYIQTSQAEMILNNQFDTIYHEHISFFNINSFKRLVNRSKLNLVGVTKTPVHGISYLFALSKLPYNHQEVRNEIEVERQRGLLSKKTYDNYRINVVNLVSDFKELVNNSKREGFKLVGYGAAAKGMTFLNFADVKLDVIIDDNPLKQELYTPGTNIPIKSIEHLKSYNESDKILFIPLAWNFYDEIRKRIKDVRDNDNDWFLKYFPKVKLER